MASLANSVKVPKGCVSARQINKRIEAMVLIFGVHDEYWVNYVGSKWFKVKIAELKMGWCGLMRSVSARVPYILIIEDALPTVAG